jgi:hypothetical protein
MYKKLDNDRSISLPVISVNHKIIVNCETDEPKTENNCPAQKNRYE